MSQIPDLGGPLRNVQIEMRLLHGPFGSNSADTLLRSQTYRDMSERKRMDMRLPSAVPTRFGTPIIIERVVRQGDPARVGEVVVTCRFRRRPSDPTADSQE